MKFVPYPNYSNQESDSFEDLILRAQNLKRQWQEELDEASTLFVKAAHLAQRWQNEIDDCASFDFAAAANAAATADECEENFDLFAAYAAAEADSSYVADLDGLVSAVEDTSSEWEDERRQAAAVDLLDPAEDEADLGFSFYTPIAA